MSDKPKKVIIIGAGIGGILTAALLAQKGYETILFEKNNFIGGRCGGMYKNGHRFDVGATLLMMPNVYKEAFASLGKSFEQEINLLRMNPSYRIFFADGHKLDLSPDLTSLKTQLESIEKGSYNKFLKYMKDSSKTFPLAWNNFIDRNYYRLTDMVNLRNLYLLFKVNAHKNFYGTISKYFKSDKLRSVFTLQCLYIGLNPIVAPGIFYSLPGMELNEGVWFPKGGMNQIASTLIKSAEEKGVKIHLSSEVQKIETAGNQTKGVKLANGEFYEADIVVANADLPYTYFQLLPTDKQTKTLDKLKYACSAFVFHWEMEKVYHQLEQHNVFISQDYKKYLKSVFDNFPFDEDITFYLHSPCQEDKTAAPEGQDSITVIVPFKNLSDSNGNDTEDVKEKIKRAIINRLKKEGLLDVEKHIKSEMVFTPEKWKSMLNLSHGSTFGSLDHNLFQMCYFRPQNQHKKYKNLFFVGGSTHPGSGVPMTLVSAKLTTEKILKMDK